jgi:DNA polymerase-3 subunit beta
MNFTADRDSLVSSLNIVLRGVSSRTTLPILKGILVKSDSETGTVYFSSSDLEISIENHIETNVTESGSIVVAAKFFSDIIRKLPPGLVEISIIEGNMVNIQSGIIVETLQGIPADEFPKIEHGGEGEAFSFDGFILKEMIRRTAFAASIEEARGIITGVLFEVKKDVANMVALDGYRMAIVREPVTGEDEKTIIISSKIMSDISKIISDSGEQNNDILIKIGENKVFFELNNSRVVARLMEGDFIKYKEILPKEKKTTIKIKKDILFDSVERASLLVREGKNTFIRFKIEENILTITSRADEGKYLEEIVVEKEGEDIEIGFNGRFVSDTLKVISDEEIVMLFNTSISPCLVQPVSGDNYEYLILPVRLSTGNI